MAKRFSSTDIWGEDWFLDMPNEYKLFWYYMLSNCDHSGLFKVNLRSFCGLLEVKIDRIKILHLFNNEKQRVRVINDNYWLIEDFFVYQYGVTFNINNPLHRGIYNLYNKNNIELSSIRGLKEVNLTLKDKDKEIDKEHSPLDSFSKKTEEPEWWRKAASDFLNDKKFKSDFSSAKNIPYDDVTARVREFISDLNLKGDYKDLPAMKKYFINSYNKWVENNGNSQARGRKSVSSQAFHEAPPSGTDYSTQTF